MTQLYHYDWAYVPFTLTRMTFFGFVPFDLTWCDLFWLSTEMTSRENDSNQLMTQVAFQGIDSESTHDSSVSPCINSDRLITQAAFQGIDSELTHDLADPQVLIQIGS